ncbi:MAG: hypothetical protein ACM359_17835 [Bacillota bacterium]
MKQICWLAIVLLAALVAPVHAQTRAVKLWPQITPGIYNHANVLAMRCEVADDGLTVTDAAWDSYQVAGCAKRWTVNMGAPMDGPLKNYKFAPEFSGLPINLTVEFYNPAKPWEVKENYQEIILLGGKQRIGLPEWFHIPTNRLAYDFDEGEWFPSGWTLPRGKYALWQGAAKARQQDRKGQCPMYDFGFTHVAPVAMTHNGSSGTRERRAYLFGDNEWIAFDGAKNGFSVDPTDPKNWQIEPLHHHADSCSIIIPDFEAPNSHGWKDYQYEAFGKLIGEVREHHPDVLIGCWGVGVLKSSFRIFDSFWEGKPTGVVDLNGARQWREKYDNPAADMNSVFKRCNLNFGNPSVYWINNSKPSQLYAFLQEWEQGKRACPQVPNVLSTWIQVEFVDGYPLSQYRFTDAKGKVWLEDLKHQVPASSTYALSLFGHCVMDGLQCWEIGTRYSEQLDDYSDWRAREPIAKRTINGVEAHLNYYVKYFGFYNFHVLGMWQASQNKDIIEATTAWEMPEIRTSKHGVWRVGDERYPSFVNYYKEPLARIKLSADGKTLLVVACNPHNKGVEKVTLRRPGKADEYRFDLVGDWPIIRRFAVAEISNVRQAK